MPRWPDTGELAAKCLDSEVRAKVGKFAINIKEIIEVELAPGSNADEARKAKVTLAARFINDSVLDPLISGEMEPGLVAFLALVDEHTDIAYEIPPVLGQTDPSTAG